MKYLFKHRKNSKQINKRAAALFILLCLIVISLLSGVLLFIHTDHVHDHSGIGGICTACVQIQNAENTLKQLGTAVNGGAVVWIILYAAAEVVKIIFSNIAVFTPVISKIRMNN